MKRLFQAAGLFAFVLCSLHAQTLTSQAEIPFDFRMGTTIFPAGKYVVHQSGYLLTIREEGGTKRSAMQLTMPASRKAVSSQPKLEFHRYGATYFLTAIWNQNSREGQVLPQSKQEQELLSHAQSLQTASISLR